MTQVKKTFLTQGKKTIKFLDRMVHIVFYSTFVFTIVVGYYAYIKDWDHIIELLVDKWFEIMVKELIVMGVIQLAKEGFSSFTRRGEMKYEMQLRKEIEEEEVTDDGHDY